jgi:hypothetical protein
MQVDEKALEAARQAYQASIPDGAWHADGGKTDTPMRAAIDTYLSALGEQEPIAFVSKRVIDAFDVNGTEIVDAMLFPRGTLRPTEERPLYASPLPVRPITDEDVERAAKAILREMETNRSAFPDTRDLARAALEAAGGRG